MGKQLEKMQGAVSNKGYSLMGQGSIVSNQCKLLEGNKWFRHCVAHYSIAAFDTIRASKSCPPAVMHAPTFHMPLVPP